MPSTSVTADISPSFGQLNKLYSVVDELVGAANLSVVVELGARYGEDTVELAKQYPNALVFAFECNPHTLPAIKERISNYPAIRLTEKAVVEKEGSIPFYPINAQKTKTTWSDGNQGASSVFQASGHYPLEDFRQDCISVAATTLFSFLENNRIPSIDLMWMDIQGAELKALKGLKGYISDLKIVHLEVEFIEIYRGQPLFADVDAFMSENNFFRLGFTAKTRFSGDVVYANKRLFGADQLANAIRLFPVEHQTWRSACTDFIFPLRYTLFKLSKVFSNKKRKKPLP